MMKYLVKLIVFTLLLFSKAGAQVPMEIETLKLMMGQNHYSMRISFTLFKNIKLKDTLEYQSLDYSIYEAKYHYKTGQYELISDGKISLVINHDDKIVIVNNIAKTEKVTIKKEVAETFLDSLKMEEFDVKLISSKAGNLTYSFVSKDENNPIQYFYFTINSIEFTPKRIMIVYRKNIQGLIGFMNQLKVDKADTDFPVLIIDYPKFEYLDKPELQLYSVNNLINIKKNRISAEPKLAGYKIINYLRN